MSQRIEESMNLLLNIHKKQTYRQTDRQRDGHTDNQIDRQTARNISTFYFKYNSM